MLDDVHVGPVASGKFKFVLQVRLPPRGWISFQQTVSSRFWLSHVFLL